MRKVIPHEPKPPRRLGQFAGEAKIRDDFDELPVDIAEAMSGERRTRRSR